MVTEAIYLSIYLFIFIYFCRSDFIAPVVVESRFLVRIEIQRSFHESKIQQIKFNESFGITLLYGWNWLTVLSLLEKNYTLMHISYTYLH